MALLTIESLLRPAYRLLLALGTILLLLTAYLLITEERPALPYQVMQDAPDISASDMAAFTDRLRGILEGKESGTPLTQEAEWFRYPLHVEVWHKHTMVGEALSLGGDAEQSKEQLALSFAQLRGSGQSLTGEEILSVTFFYQPEKLDRTSSPQQLRGFLTPARHGVYFSCHDTGMLMPNLRWITREMSSGEAATKLYMQWLGCDDVAVRGGYGTVTRFETSHWVQQRAQAEPQRWYRSHYPVDPTITTERLVQLKDENIHWVLTHMEPSGALPYLLFRSNESPPSNQLIRQWLVTVSLGREAQATGSAVLREAFMRNLRYNLKSFAVRQEDRLYFSLENKQGWLATSSIAADALLMAIRYDASLESEYRAVLAGILHQWSRQGIWNGIITPNSLSLDAVDVVFVPGASLMALVQAREAGYLDDVPVEKLVASYDYYQQRWQESGKPLSPWLILAGSYLLPHAGEAATRIEASIFTMADRIVECQVPDRNPNLEIGSFAGCPGGTPLYLSTAMRIEGLLMAHALAVENGLAERQSRYAESLSLAWRHVLQGQAFAEQAFHVDTAYLKGTVPYTATQSYIRIDAPPHVIAPAQRALTHGPWALKAK